MYKRILVPTDGSAISALAAEDAIRLARCFGSDIVALSVAFPEPYLGGVEGGIVTESAPQRDLLLMQAEEHAGAVAKRAEAAGVQCTAITAYSLSPGSAIIEAAQDNQCDLIFMGSHGRRGLSRLIAGSVAQHVMAYAPLPVMILRPPLEGGPATLERADA